MFTDSELWSLEQAVSTRIHFCADQADSNFAAGQLHWVATWAGQKAQAQALLTRIHQEIEHFDDSALDGGA